MWPWDKESSFDDKYEFLKDPQPSDLVVAVMGRTGVGKSTFVNLLCGDGAAVVGCNLTSETSKVQHHPYSHPRHGERILIVDTPGFDDIGVTEEEILRRIAVWLAKSYAAKMKLVGLVYIFDINSDRYTASEAKSYRIFEKLCGKDWATKVVLATSKWDKPGEEKYKVHCETQLREKYWQDMYSRGSTIHRLGGTQELGGESAKESPQDSAEKVMNSILSHGHTGYVAIQQELVDQKKKLKDTEAGKVAVEKKDNMLMRGYKNIRSKINSS